MPNQLVKTQSLNIFLECVDVNRHTKYQINVELLCFNNNPIQNSQV